MYISALDYSFNNDMYFCGCLILQDILLYQILNKTLMSPETQV